MTMNNYPQWWDTTVTIYNRFDDPQSRIITWFRYVVPDCFWKNVSDKISIGDNIVESNSIICRIRKNDNFLPKHQWIELSAEEKATKFTLGRGDIIVCDEVFDVISEYGTSSTKATDLINKYKDLQGCMVINRVTIDTGGGRCSEHYNVKGE